MYPDRVRAGALSRLADGHSISQTSRDLGVARATLRAWRDDGPRPQPPGSCPRCEGDTLDEASYAALLGYYLGDGCISTAPRYFALRVSCDQTYPGIIGAVEAAVRGVRPRTTVFRVAAPGTVVVQAHWKHWPCLFPQHGPGRKHERPIVLEDWQREIVEGHPAELLRGLFHSDGSRVANWASRTVAGEHRRYDYPRWQFPSPQPELARAEKGEEIEEGRRTSERSDEECDPSRNPSAGRGVASRGRERLRSPGGTPAPRP